MLKSPSKHIGLERLKQIRIDNYLGAGGQEYASCEVDSLIIEKEYKAALQYEQAQWREYVQAHKPPEPTLESIRGHLERMMSNVKICK